MKFLFLRLLRKIGGPLLITCLFAPAWVFATPLISNLPFDKIQDVTVDIHGLIPTMLNFGTVEVETASKEDDGDFVMRAVRDPDNVRRVIFDRHNGN